MTDPASGFSLDDLLDSPVSGASIAPTNASDEPLVEPLSLDDIRKRVMADQPITLEEERALLHSIRRGYSVQVAKAPAVRRTPSAAGSEPRRVAASATKGAKLSTTQMFAGLGGLDALK